MSYIEINASDGPAFRAWSATPEGGTGPGLVLLQEAFGITAALRQAAQLFAEEGYHVLVPDLYWRITPGVDLDYGPAGFERAMDLYGRFDADRAVDDILTTVGVLRAMPECTGGVGVLGYCLGGRLAYLTACRSDVDVAVGYYGVGIEHSLDEAEKLRSPLVLHYGGEDQHAPPEAMAQVQAALADRGDVAIYSYPGADHGFANPDRPEYHAPAAGLAHSRTLAALHKAIGPEYDLSALWDEHCLHEFITGDVEKLMQTMVAEPYVNISPTQTGGYGQADLTRFYRDFFVKEHPADTRLVPISRTVGADRVVDEMVYAFTHDKKMPWMLPGIEPTGKPVEVPMVAVVSFRGPKIYHEHIYWDQASVLRQIGLLPDELPAMGVEAARKVVDETLPTNELLEGWSGGAT